MPEGTRIYGASDDLLNSDGEYYAEGNGRYDDEEKGLLVFVSDGTILQVKYGKGDLAIWGIQVIRQGSLFDHIEYCNNEDAEMYSDIVFLKPGIKFIYISTNWELMEQNSRN